MGRVVKVVAQLPMSVEREVTLRGAGGPLGKWDSDLETDDSGFSSTKIFSIRVPETQKQCVLSFKLVKDKANWETGANHIVDLRQYSEDVVQIELSGVKFG